MKKRTALTIGPKTTKALTAIARNLNKTTGMSWTGQEVLTAAASQGLAYIVREGHPSVKLPDSISK